MMYQNHKSKSEVRNKKKFRNNFLIFFVFLLFIQMLSLNKYYVKGEFLEGINKIYSSKVNSGLLTTRMHECLLVK